MISNSDYIAYLNGIEKKVTRLNDEHKDARQQWANDKCPVKVGDVVTVNDFAHHGKRIKVDRVAVWQSYSGKWEWVVGGFIIKRDGTLSEKQRGKSTYKVLED